MRIAGSLWSVPLAEQAARLQDAVRAGLKEIHWDATDGRFAASGGFTPEQAEMLSAAVPGLIHEAHLMMTDPLGAVDAWAQVCQLILVPVESQDPLACLRRIESRGARAGLAVSLDTDLARVPRGDFPVLAMAIAPGQAGQPFSWEVNDRVNTLAARRCHTGIGVDGGVGPAQIPALREAGATWVVSGGSLFAAPDLPAWFAKAQA